MIQICRKSPYQQRVYSSLSRFVLSKISIFKILNLNHGGVCIHDRNFSTGKENVAMGSLEHLLRVKPAIEFDEEEEMDTEGLLEDDIMEEGQSDPREKLARALLKLSRVHYRHGEDYPDWFVSNQREICTNRTTSQIRRCLKDWMIKNDREFHQKFRGKPLLWGDLFRDNQTLEIHEYGPEESVAYSHFFMPSRYQILTRLMKELRLLAPEFAPRRIIDFGCGPATGAAAAFTAWGDQKDALQKYTGIDMSQSMIDAGKIMTKGPNAIPDCIFWDKTADVVRRAVNNNERFDLAIVSYTLTELSNDPSRRAAVQLLFELLDVGGYLVILEAGNPYGSHTVRTARQLVLDIFNNADKDGNFDASPKFYDSKDVGAKKSKEEFAMKKEAARSFSKLSVPAPTGYQHDQIGAFVVSPCTHDKPCPLTSETWCSFSQKVYSGLVRKASEEKFSYVVIQKRPKHPQQQQQEQRAKKVKSLRRLTEEEKNKVKAKDFGLWTEHTALATIPNQDDVHPTPIQVLERFAVVRERDDVLQLLNNLIDEVEWSAYNPPLFRQEWGRILRSPIKGRGHITMDLCNSDGLIQRMVLSRSNLIFMPAIFSAIRKSSWGGLFPAIKEEKDGVSLVETLRSPLALTAKGIIRNRQSLQEYEEEKGHQAASANNKGHGKDKHKKASALQTLGRRSSTVDNTMMTPTDLKRFPREIGESTNERNGSKRGRGAGRKVVEDDDIEEDDDDFEMKKFLHSNTLKDDRARSSRITMPSPRRMRGGRGAESEDSSMMRNSSIRIDGSREGRGKGRAGSSVSVSRGLSEGSKRSPVMDVVEAVEKAEPAVGKGRKGRLPRPSRPAPRARKQQDEDDDDDE